MVFPLSIRYFLKRIAVAALSGYLALLVMLVAGERHFVYQDRAGPSTPAEAGLAGFTAKTLEAEGLPRILYWESAAQPSAPTVLYFHGNGGGLHLHVPMLATLAKLNLHLIAMEYPGYPGGEGSPSEAVIVAQAVALYDAIAKREDRTPAIWGFSLGSAVATQLAAQRTPSALVLEAPPSAIVDRAAELFPIVPVRHIMRNQFRTREHIANVNAPLLILHGTNDRIVPIHHGRALYALAREPKEFQEYEGFHHLNLMDSSAYADAVGWLHKTAR